MAAYGVEYNLSSEVAIQEDVHRLMLGKSLRADQPGCVDMHLRKPSADEPPELKKVLFACLTVEGIGQRVQEWRTGGGNELSNDGSSGCEQYDAAEPQVCVVEVASTVSGPAGVGVGLASM